MKQMPRQGWGHERPSQPLPHNLEQGVLLLCAGPLLTWPCLLLSRGRSGLSCQAEGTSSVVLGSWEQTGDWWGICKGCTPNRTV